MHALGRVCQGNYEYAERYIRRMKCFCCALFIDEKDLEEMLLGIATIDVP